MGQLGVAADLWNVFNSCGRGLPFERDANFHCKHFSIFPADRSPPPQLFWKKSTKLSKMRDRDKKPQFSFMYCVMKLFSACKRSAK